MVIIQKQHDFRKTRSFCHSARQAAYQSVLLLLIKSFTVTGTINRSLQLSNRHVLIWLEFRASHLDSCFLDLKHRKKFPKRNFLNAIEILLQSGQLLNNRCSVYYLTSIGEMVQLQQALPTCKCRKTPTVEACYSTMWPKWGPKTAC